MRPPRPLIVAVSALGLLPTAYCLPGCSFDGDPKAHPTTRTSDAALQDPFGKWSSDVNTDISGGPSNNLNRDALKRDVDNFWLK